MKSGNIHHQGFGMAPGHHFPALLGREEAKGQSLRISTPWCIPALGCSCLVPDPECLFPMEIDMESNQEWGKVWGIGRSSHKDQILP